MENNNLQLTPKQWISIGSFSLIMVLNYYFKNPELYFIQRILFLYVSTLVEKNYKRVDKYNKT